MNKLLLTMKPIKIFTTLLFVISLFSFPIARAQVSIDWLHSYQTGTVSYGAIASAIDQQDNLYYLVNFKDTMKRQVLFTHDSLFSPEIQMQLVKTSPSGQVIWTKSWQNAHGRLLEIDDSGNLILAGDFNGITDFNPDAATSFQVKSDTVGSNAEFLLKLDSNAAFNWVNCIGGFALQVRSLTTGINNEIIWAGMFYGNVDFDPTPANNTITGNIFDMYLQKFDSNGVVQYTYTYVSSGTNTAFDIAVNTKGDLYAAGVCSNIDFDPSANSSPMQSNANFLVKYNAAGDYQWVQYWEVTPTAIEIDAQNNDIYIGGNFSGSPDFDPGNGVQTYSSSGGKDAFAIRLDSNAQFVWAQTIGGSGNDQVQVMDYKNPFLVVGMTFEASVSITNSSTPTLHTSKGATDLLTASIDSSGFIDVNDSYGSSGIDAFQSISIKNVGTYYFSGTYENNILFNPANGADAGTPYNRSNFFLAEANRFTVGLAPSPAAKAKIHLYPNPSKGLIQLESSERTLLVVYNSFGQKVVDYALPEGKQTLNFNALSKGVYYFHFSSNESVSSVQKVIFAD